MKPRDEQESGYLTRCLIIRKTRMAYYNRSKCDAASPRLALLRLTSTLPKQDFGTLSAAAARAGASPIRSRNMRAYL